MHITLSLAHHPGSRPTWFQLDSGSRRAHPKKSDYRTSDLHLLIPFYHHILCYTYTRFNNDQTFL